MQKTGDNCIWYTYDESGNVSGCRYGLNEYYFYRNGQGDIIGIVNELGILIAKYSYDAWGNILSITGYEGEDVSGNPNHIANINPFRYRGYFYDTETGLYYLQSRYYDPQVGRFINADGIIGANDYTLFNYCGNNPIMLSDPSGMIGYEGCMYIRNMIIENTSLKFRNKADISAKFEQMRIDTDGRVDDVDAGTLAPKNMPDLKSTWFTNIVFDAAEGNGLAAYKENYIVLPGSYSKSGRASAGDFAIVFDHNTGNYVYAVVGDNDGKYDRPFGEVSLSVAWNLGYKDASGNNGPKGNFEVFVFPGTKKKLYAGSYYEMLDETFGDIFFD